MRGVLGNRRVVCRFQFECFNVNNSVIIRWRIFGCAWTRTCGCVRWTASSQLPFKPCALIVIRPNNIITFGTDSCGINAYCRTSRIRSRKFPHFHNKYPAVMASGAIAELRKDYLAWRSACFFSFVLLFMSIGLFTKICKVVFMMWSSVAVPTVTQWQNSCPVSGMSLFRLVVSSFGWTVPFYCPDNLWWG